MQTSRGPHAAGVPCSACLPAGRRLAEHFHRSLFQSPFIDLLRSRRDGRQRDEVSPSALKGERAGVRGEKIEKRPISPAD
jgi:hypothetical protein